MKTTIFLLLFVTLLHSAPQVVKVGAFNYFPAIFQDQEDKVVKGFFVDILNDIGEKENIKFEFVYGSWNDGISRLKSGEVDLLTSVGITEERKEFMDYCPTKLLTVWGVLYVKSGAEIDGILEMNGRKIGLMKGDLNGAHFKEFANSFGINCNYVEYPFYDNLFSAVQAGEVDAGVASVLYGTARHSKFGLRTTSTIFKPFDIFFTVKKGANRELMTTLDRYLHQWKDEENSIYAQAREKWLYGVREKSIWSRKFRILVTIAILVVILVIFGTIFISKKRIRSLRKKHERADSLFQSISKNLENGFVYQIDSGVSNNVRNFLFVSQGVAAITGHTPEEIYTNSSLIYGAIDAADIELLAQKEFDAVQSKTILNCEARIVHTNGDIHWIHITSIPHEESDKRLIWDGIALDITLQKKSQERQAYLIEQLHQSQKMDAIGQLAGGVAHDFNNSLGVIMGATEMVKINSASPEKQQKFIEMIITACERSRELTQKLLLFSRKGNIITTVVDCATIVKETASLLEHTIDKGISIIVENLSTKSSVIGNITIIQNAIMNIGINASHAMPNGGQLSFTLENVDLDEDYCKASPFNLKAGIFLEIEIRDTGTGIPPEILSRIFEPFFTTKGSGKGTGLGLTAVYGTIQELGGAITVYSEVGTGTVFHIYLPVVATEQKEIKIEENNLDDFSGSGKILLIDDEELIRVTAKAILMSLGYEVILANNGLEGVNLFSELKDEIDLVILDMIMPIMNGREAFIKIREINSQIPIIIASGFAKDDDLMALKKDNANGFLHKPFRRTEIACVIKTIMQNKTT